MAIGLDIFTDAFDELHGAFDRSVKKNTATVWYKEVQYWDYQVFDTVMRKLQDFENFPRLRDAKTLKKNLETDFRPLDERKPKVNYCYFCDAGEVAYRKVDDQGKVKAEYLGRCAKCHNDHLEHLPPVDGEAIANKQGWELHPNHKIIQGFMDRGEDPYVVDGPAVTKAKMDHLQGMGYGKPTDAAREKKRKAISVAINNPEVAV